MASQRRTAQHSTSQHSTSLLSWYNQPTNQPTNQSINIKMNTIPNMRFFASLINARSSSILSHQYRSVPFPSVYRPKSTHHQACTHTHLQKHTYQQLHRARIGPQTQREPINKGVYNKLQISNHKRFRRCCACRHRCCCCLAFSESGSS